jgi:predicted transcriptional regulator
MPRHDIPASLVSRRQQGYNFGMKTAVSIPDPVFRAAEQLAKRLKLSRSRLYALALTEFVDRHADDTITRRLNASLAASPPPADAFAKEAAYRTARRNAW